MTSNMRVSNGRIGLGTGTTSIVIHYTQNISVPNGTNKDDFKQILKQHKEDVVSIIKREFERKERLAY